MKPGKVAEGNGYKYRIQYAIHSPGRQAWVPRLSQCRKPPVLWKPWPGLYFIQIRL